MTVERNAGRSADSRGANSLDPNRASRRRTWVITGGAGALSVLMRLPMLWSRVSVDEGAYLAVARAWAHGHVLYRDVFVDRPQGLFVLFRVWDWISGGNTASIRIMAMLFGVLLVVSTGVIVREVAGERAARFAVVLCAVVSAAPVLEGYAANTELLSGAVSAAGLAVGVLAFSKRHPLRWFFGAGLLAGIALSLKQSGFDGVVALVASLSLTVIVSANMRAMALKAAASLVAGTMTVVAAMMIHGALTGWSSWLTAVAGYRLTKESAFASADWSNLAFTARYAFVVLGTCALLAIVGVEAAAPGLWRRLQEAFEPQLLLLWLWFFAASLGFLIGGGFWRHYWLLLAAPLSALAAVGVSRVPRLRSTVLTLALAPCLWITIWVYSGDTAHLNVRAAGDHRAVLDERVAQWFSTHRQRGQNLYVMCSSAAAYADAHQDPGYPYLWTFEVRHAPNAETGLAKYLSDPLLGPQFIAQYQGPDSCDPSGRVGQILSDSFHRVAVVGPVVMLERTTIPNNSLRPITRPP